MKSKKILPLLSVCFLFVSLAYPRQIFARIELSTGSILLEPPANAIPTDPTAILLDMTQHSDPAKVITAITGFIRDNRQHADSRLSIFILIDLAKAVSQAADQQGRNGDKRVANTITNGIYEAIPANWNVISIMSTGAASKKLLEEKIFTAIFTHLHDTCPYAIFSRGKPTAIPKDPTSCVTCENAHFKTELHHDGRLLFEDFQHRLESHYGDLKITDHASMTERYINKALGKVPLARPPAVPQFPLIPKSTSPSTESRKRRASEDESHVVEESPPSLAHQIEESPSTLVQKEDDRGDDSITHVPNENSPAPEGTPVPYTSALGTRDFYHTPSA